MTSANQPDRSQQRGAGFGSLATFGPRNIFTDIVQGIIVGCVLAFISFQIIAHAYVTKANGWTTMLGCGEPGNGALFRAACADEFPGPINVSQEAMYWMTRVDSTGQKLSGQHNYIMHFPAGQLPPNNAFWSLTMGTARNRFVPNPIDRYSMSDRSDLVPNADGSVDIYIQNAAPAGHAFNWLPAPTDNFILWLRVYLPGAAILNGGYRVPPVVEAR
ncbi:MAG: DUF1214 domain-containing protein [Acidobacteriaceae bacterium]